MTDRAGRVEALFHQALGFPPERRAEFLEAETRDDPSVGATVASLLAADTTTPSQVLDQLARAADRLFDPVPDRLGTELGPYRVLELIGSGGMGVVFLAERADVGARVALKILRDPLSPEATRRFLEERRVLAKLRHPHIAQLFDAGTDQGGAPWFAMEHVAGRSLVDYARSERLGGRPRLRLFRAVCEAVGYAHQQLVIHRDLKPSNVVVAADGIAKLVDFGVAEPAGGGDGPRRGLTPAYAAPELLAGAPGSVSSDIYSLGVILGELLLGWTPLAVGGLPSAGSGASTAPGDRVDAHDVRRLVATATAADPAHRYQSVDAMIRDIDSLLGELPLAAQARSGRHQLRKLWRRRRAAIVGGLLLALGLGAAAVSYTIGLRRARADAVAEARRARELQRLLVGMFQGGEDAVGPADSLRVVAMVDRGAAEAAALTGEPALRADLYEALGTVFRQLGRLDRADSMLGLALDERRRGERPDSQAIARSMIALGLLRVDQGKLPDALDLVQRATDLMARTDPGDPRQRAEGHEALAEVFEHAGRYPEALRALRLAIAAAGPVADSAAELAPRWLSLANNHYYAGALDSAELYNQRVLRLWTARHGEGHPRAADVLINLGAIAQDQRKFAAAESLYARGAVTIERWYGPDHLRTASAVSMLGRIALLQAQRDRADSLIRRALTIRRKVLGPEHPRVGLMLNELANLAFGRERWREAESLFVAALTVYRRAYPGAHQYAGASQSGLASVYLAQGQFRQAEQAARDAIATYLATLTANHQNVGIARVKLGRALHRQRRQGEAEAEARTGYEILLAQTGAQSPWTRAALPLLVEIYRSLGDQPNAARFAAVLADTGTAGGR